MLYPAENVPIRKWSGLLIWRSQPASNIIVGVGGGKVLDTSKGVATKTGLPLAIVPTSAAHGCTVFQTVCGI